RLRSDVTRLLRFPDAFADDSTSVGLLERMFLDQLPRRLFDLLMRNDEREILEVPGIGGALHKHMLAYYRFRQDASRLEEELMLKIGKLSAPRFRAAWAIHFRYTMMRLGGISQDEIIACGNF